MERIEIKHNVIALIIRGKKSAEHNPGINSHADCILPGGEPLGYFSAQGTQSGGDSSGSWHSVGLNQQGQVIDYSIMKRALKAYTNPEIAHSKKLYSTILLIEIDAIEAISFKNYWSNLKTKPDGFRLLGNNCSTHASKAFIKAKILRRGIPGLDTPNNLYKQLLELKDRRMISYSGFVGHCPSRTPGNTDLLIIKSN